MTSLRRKWRSSSSARLRAARKQRSLRADSARRGSAPSGMTIRTHSTVDTFWNVEDDPSSTVRFVTPEKEQKTEKTAARSGQRPHVRRV